MTSEGRLAAKLPADAASSGLLETASPIICFSHLRWDFVFQRPQHLMSRAAATRPVYFWEEPKPSPDGQQTVAIRHEPGGVVVATPCLPEGLDAGATTAALRDLLDGLVEQEAIRHPVLWYYTPQALPFSHHLKARFVAYDCMDELSAFNGADPSLPLLERALLGRADVVFTGGFSLYEVKRQQHASVHPLPSGVDIAHFARARAGMPDPADQAGIGHPRLGFYGVIDERMDRQLLHDLAKARPDWQIVMIGPVAKVDPASLPRLANVHYLGMKSYDDLPSYVANWDAALMPFALNEATRFISPTKTPEYLAAGLPVVSTPIVDVQRHYGKIAAVQIAPAGAPFIAAAEKALALAQAPASWRAEADALLASASWDGVWARMEALLAARAAAPAGQHRPPRVSGLSRSYDVLVVGAGFAGSVLAERLAANGSRVLLIDRRAHIAGNAYDHEDAAGVLIHRYGPHIFHTNSEQIVAYLSRFTRWRPYEHRVRARIGEAMLPVPINRTTINGFFGLDLREHEVEAFLASKAEPVETVRTSADVVLGTVGRELYEAFFQGYTRKQWGVDPSMLDKSVTARIPTRTNDDDRYFTDSFQAMPLHGFTRMFETMLDHPNITRMLGVDYRDVQDEIACDHLVFTGPVDEYFDYRYGKLPYRSLRFEHATLPTEQHQPVAVVNYPSPDVPYTRVTEFKHLTGQRHAKTSICHEFPSASGDPYYPVPRPENAALYAKYQALAAQTTDVTFVGRLATYRYYNMDQVVGQALTAYKRLAARGLRRTGLPSHSRGREIAAAAAASPPVE